MSASASEADSLRRRNSLSFANAGHPHMARMILLSQRY